MLKRAIVVVQDHLKAKGHYAGPSHGIADAATDAAVTRGLAQRQAEIPAGATGFPLRRRLVMMLQLICKDKGIACDPIDGYWGQITQTAWDSLVFLMDHGRLPEPWRDRDQPAANPQNWPRDTGSQAEMRGFFGQPGRPPIKKVACPWPLKLAWAPAQRVTHIGCHAKVADSLGRVLAKVHAHYGTPELARLRLDLYGGCFANRKKRGGTTWSTHAWAAAIDWDPARNQLTWGRDRASLAAPVYDFWWKAWEAEGWVSLGRSRNFDWMHVQAARL
jgi:hypothetical protein